MAVHILWDWNGTLLDDTQAALDTLNIMLAKRGAAPIAMDFYRDHFAFPVRPFYKSIGVCLENEDWDALAREYHDIYARQPKRLNAEAIAALERAKAAGARQAIISALRQDLLDAATAALGVATYMDLVYGVDNLDGASKLDRGRELVAAVGGGAPIFIGDTLHDAEVARELGGRCILVSCGHQLPERLAAAGCPVTDTLADAVRLAARLHIQQEPVPSMG